MFEITPENIAVLNDVQLRTLIGLLCEADLRAKGLSPVAVTYSGDQRAPDGGIDVRVALPTGTPIAGFIPRAATGFQVKCQDMPRGTVLTEMAPGGKTKQAIVDLANAGGAYIIASSQGSVADDSLIRRKDAMAEALNELPNADALALDFYDRTRIATWVREHPSLILWVRRQISRDLVGWQPYGPWSFPGEPDAKYITDKGVAIRPRPTSTSDDLSTLDGLARLGTLLSVPRSIIRLVGLSGVGKTRFVQALFESEVGTGALDPSLAIYTNMNDAPTPPPASLATDLVFAGTRAILIVDNCSDELHARLAEIARSANSAISVITIEYDIKEDQPEGTDAYEVRVASTELIEALVRKRVPSISQIDARTAAEVSGGNARIALVLAETVSRGGTLQQLNDEQLYKRLFMQRQEYDRRLHEIAQACSLVYSYNGEDISDAATGEMAVLGGLVGATVEEVHSATAELLRRDLAQRRGPWRAILPHALANKLAVLALQNIPHAKIEAGLACGSERIARSFSRRLGYLHDCTEARAFVSEWFAEDGWISNVWNQNKFGQDIFTNALPVDPEGGLGAIERSLPEYSDDNPIVIDTYLPLALRTVAYDPLLFDRATEILRFIAVAGDAGSSRTATEIHSSLFTIVLSGTLTGPEQRVANAKRLISSNDAAVRKLGFAALGEMLRTNFFSSHYDFQFGAHSRTYGFHPTSNKAVMDWYGVVLRCVSQLVLSGGQLATEAEHVLAEHFRGLWAFVELRGDIENLLTKLAKKSFWPEGWKAVKFTRNFDAKDRASESYARLSALEMMLRPNDLVQKVRGRVLAPRGGYLETEDDEEDGGATETHQSAYEKVQEEVDALGQEVSRDSKVLAELLPELVSSNGNLWYFGRGLAKATNDLVSLWDTLAGAFNNAAEGTKNPQVLCGVLSHVKKISPEIADKIFQDFLHSDAMGSYFPWLQNCAGIDQAGTVRLIESVGIGKAKMPLYDHLILWPISGSEHAKLTAEFLLALIAMPGGQSPALHNLQMLFYMDQQRGTVHAPELLQVGRTFLTQLDSSQLDHNDGYRLGNLVRNCLVGEEGERVARAVGEKLLDDIGERKTTGFQYNDLLKALFSTHPLAVLDVFLGGTDARVKMAMTLIASASYLRERPTEQVSVSTLRNWAEKDPEARYVRLAAIVGAFVGTRDAPSGWHPVAFELVHNAPDPIAVMREFVARLHPDTWNGSYASALEGNAKLLDEFDARGNDALATYIAQEKEKLAAEAQRHRKWELSHSRERYETFEP